MSEAAIQSSEEVIQMSEEAIQMSEEEIQMSEQKNLVRGGRYKPKFQVVIGWVGSGEKRLASPGAARTERKLLPSVKKHEYSIIANGWKYFRRGVLL